MGHGFFDPLFHATEENGLLLFGRLDLVVVGSSAAADACCGCNLLAELDIVDGVACANFAEVDDDAVGALVFLGNGEFNLAGHPVSTYVEISVGTLTAVGGAVLILELKVSRGRRRLRLELDDVGSIDFEGNVESIGALGLISVGVGLTRKFESGGAVNADAFHNFG